MEHRIQIIALIFVTLLLAGCSRGAKVCAVCQRDECKAMAFRITLDSGKVIETCCPRCGLHYLEASKHRPRRLEATDFATGHWMDAVQAAFVSGSDFPGCAIPEARRDAQGCCMMKDYDRCLPSLVAFTDRAAAVGFQNQHGGQLLALAEISAKSVKTTSNMKE
jgi:nitrous oxide reductase accessory protein NosL